MIDVIKNLALGILAMGVFIGLPMFLATYVPLSLFIALGIFSLLLAYVVGSAFREIFWDDL